MYALIKLLNQMYNFNKHLLLLDTFFNPKYKKRNYLQYSYTKDF